MSAAELQAMPAKVPPHDTDAEAAVLSAVMLDPGALEQVSTILRPTHFYSRANQSVFAAALKVHREGRPVDVVTVAGALRDSSTLDAVGGTPYLARLSDATPAIGHVEDHACVVLGKWRARRLIEKCRRVAAETYETPDVVAHIEQTQDELAELLEDSMQESIVRVSDLVGPALELVERRRSGDERPVPLLFAAHSEIMGGGLWPGVHTCVSGTGVGKSAFWFQSSLHAARQGVPVLYIGLELNRGQVAMRLLGERAGVSWSKLYTGHATDAEMDRVREAQGELDELPLYFEFGPPNGWAASTMLKRAKEIRRQHPDGPLLIVLDFLQIVGGEADASGRVPDLRECIKRAAYVGTHVGNEHGAAVVLVSSAARDKYSMLASTCDQAGLASREVPGFIEPRRTILNPDALLGLGKEAGEIEYAAESQMVLIRWPAPLDNGEKAIICAIPKLRYGPPSWFALSFWHRFTEMPINDTSELPEVAKRGGKGRPVGSDELEARVLETVRTATRPFKSRSSIAAATRGTKADLLKATARLLDEGTLVEAADGITVPGSAGSEVGNR